MLDTITIEYLLVIIGSTIALVKWKDNLRALLLALQVFFMVMQLAKIYLKSRANKTPVAFEDMIARAFMHYFHTHPQGIQLSTLTNMDEKLHEMMEKQKPVIRG